MRALWRLLPPVVLTRVLSFLLLSLCLWVALPWRSAAAQLVGNSSQAPCTIHSQLCWLCVAGVWGYVVCCACGSHFVCTRMHGCCACNASVCFAACLAKGAVCTAVWIVCQQCGRRSARASAARLPSPLITAVLLHTCTDDVTGLRRVLGSLARLPVRDCMHDGSLCISGTACMSHTVAC